MKTLAEKLKTWSIRVRVVSYVFGFAGVAMMLSARSMAEPARTLWAQRSFLCLGVMFGGFVTYYLLSIFRMGRR